jgi:hypothetical protein
VGEGMPLVDTTSWWLDLDPVPCSPPPPATRTTPRHTAVPDGSVATIAYQT